MVNLVKMVDMASNLWKDGLLRVGNYLLCLGFLSAATSSALGAVLPEDAYLTLADGGIRIQPVSHEEVAPFTGNLQLDNIDVHLPGNGFMDINVHRNYSAQSSWYIKSSYFNSLFMWRSSGGGLGWTFMVAPKLVKWTINAVPVNNPAGLPAPINIFKNLCSGENSHSYYPDLAINVEFPDGRREPLFYAGDGIARTRSGWRATCSNWIVSLVSPEGVTHEMENAAGAGVAADGIGQFAAGHDNPLNYYTVFRTRKTFDLNGNWIRYTYRGDGPATWGRGVCIARIDASDGRWLKFEYGSSGTVDSIESNSGHKWIYESKMVGASHDLIATISKVTFPDGRNIKYEYYDQSTTTTVQPANDFRLKRVVGLSGGVVEYEYQRSYYSYENLYIGSGLGNQYNSVQVIRKKFPDGEYNFTYVHGGIGEYDVTTVDGPQGRVSYKFIGAGFNPAKGSFAHKNTTWKVGLLAERKVGELQSESYDYDAIEVSAYPCHIGSGIEPQSDLKTWRAAPSSITTTRDGSTYSIKNSDFDEWGNARKVTETNSSGWVREISRIYYIDAGRNILHKISGEVVELK